MKFTYIKEQDLLKEIHEEHMFELLKNTVQIFIENSSDGIISLGTGILFTFESKFFILTANHNLEGENIEDLRLRSGNTLLPFPDIKVIHTKPKQNQKIDKYDIAIVEILDLEAVSIINKDLNFIELKDINLGSTQKMSKTVRKTLNDYICFGFPGRTTKKAQSDSRDFHIKPYLLTCGLNKRNLKDLIDDGYDCHLFINKMKKANKYETGERMNIRNLKGMSGGGLWDINYIDSKTGKVIIKLVGILIQETVDLYIFTKIDLVIGLMREFNNMEKLPKTMLINKVNS